MVKTFEELQDELKVLRQEMYEEAKGADIKIVASWVDRLVMSLESLTETLRGMEVEVDTACSCCSEVPEKASKKAKKPAKKPAKKKAAKKKRK